MFEVQGRRRIGEVERISLGTRVLGLVPMLVHCYRIGRTLIDAGPPHHASTLASMVGDPGIEHVVLTHHHEDHVGAAPRLARTGARVHASEAALPFLAEPPAIEPYQRRVWGRPAPVEAEAFGETIETPDVTLEVHPVPGHCPDHVALLAPDRGLLFAGDAYLPPRATLRADEALDGFLASLARMRELEAERLLPGHGSVVDEPAPALDAVLEHFIDLARRAHALAEEGHGPSAIRRRMLGLEGFIRYYTRGHYAKQNLVDELLKLDPDGIPRPGSEG